MQNSENNDKLGISQYGVLFTKGSLRWFGHDKHKDDTDWSTTV